GSETTVQVTAVAALGLDLPNGEHLGVKGIFSLSSQRNAAGKRPVMAGLRTTGEINLDTLLPAGIETDFDLALVDEESGSAAGFLFSTTSVTTRLNLMPAFAREFYRPLFGRSPDDDRDLEILLPAGLTVL